MLAVTSLRANSAHISSFCDNVNFALSKKDFHDAGDSMVPIGVAGTPFLLRKGERKPYGEMQYLGKMEIAWTDDELASFAKADEAESVKKGGK